MKILPKAAEQIASSSEFNSCDSRRAILAIDDRLLATD